MLKYTVSLTLALAIIWLLFSGMWTHPIIMPLGAVSVALAVYLSIRLGVLDREGHPLHLLPRALRYWPWLLVEITKSNLAVVGHILRGNGSIAPRIEEVDASQASELGQTIFANSITLTPGTTTIRVKDGKILFYALSEDIARGVTDGEMDRRVSRFEGDR